MRCSRYRHAAWLLAMPFALLACSDGPTSSDVETTTAQFDHKPGHDKGGGGGGNGEADDITLDVSIADLGSEVNPGIASDGGGLYNNGQENVVAFIEDGNTVNPEFNGLFGFQNHEAKANQTDRTVFINVPGHFNGPAYVLMKTGSNQSLLDMANDESKPVRLKVNWGDSGAGDSQIKYTLRYGSICGGSADIDDDMVTATRTGDNSWTIDGTVDDGSPSSALLCVRIGKGKNNGPFPFPVNVPVSLTLTRQ